MADRDTATGKGGNRLFMRLLEEYKGAHGEFFEKKARESLAMFHDDHVHLEDGIVRWKSNGRIPPDDLLELWHYAGCTFDYHKSCQRRSAEEAEAIKEYTLQRKDYVPSDEELTEMRAAFGKTVVVDAITGKKIKL